MTTAADPHPAAPARIPRQIRSPENRAQSAGPDGPLYRLADYLDQHGRQHRRDQVPSAGFCAAAAAHALPADQAVLGDAAHARGLYRDATQLHKTAAASGSPRAALYLSHPPDCLRADLRPAHWAAAHAPLDDPDDVARLLVRLREGGAGSRRRAARPRPGRRRRPPAALASRAAVHAPSTNRSAWPSCWAGCGKRAARSGAPRCWP